ncbi:MAG: hypothetical protein ACXVZX_14095 [Terriglobales bacterium]
MRVAAMSFFDAFASTVRAQRLTWTCCIVAALLLIYRFNAPVVPVLLGCIMALVITGLKSWPFRSGANR